MCNCVLKKKVFINNKLYPATFLLKLKNRCEMYFLYYILRKMFSKRFF
jgi:hypothetical protein